jgi:hypothetical protein
MMFIVPAAKRGTVVAATKVAREFSSSLDRTAGADFA